MDNSHRVIAEFEHRLFGRPLADLVSKLTIDARLTRAWRLIESGYADQDLNLKMAARTAGVSANHLNVLFLRTIGFTFHRFLIHYRLIKAVSYMKLGDRGTLEIALDVGFGSSSALERNLRKYLNACATGLRLSLLERKDS